MLTGVGARRACLATIVSVLAAGAVAVLPARPAAADSAGTRLAAATAAAPAASTTLAPSRYVPLSPTRIYDSGPGKVGTADVSVPLPRTGADAVPTTATAVVINLTGDRPSQATNVAAYPAGGPPVTSNTTSALNLAAGTTSADLVTVPLPSGGDDAITLHNQNGTIRLIVDLAGYYTAEGSGAPYVPVQPYRAYDSRTKGNTPLGTSAVTLTAAQLRVPATATALVANLTAVGPSLATNLTVWPAGTSKPAVSNLNVAKADTRANLVTVALGAHASGIELANAAGTTAYLVDVEGWYSPTATGTLYVPLATPTRIFGKTARPAAGTTPFDLALSSPVPATAAAAAFTLTVAAATAKTHAAAYPPGTTATTSNVNVDKGVATPNLVVSSLATSTSYVAENASSLTPKSGPSTPAVALSNAAGSVEFIVDLQGWFIPNTPGHDVSYAQCNESSTTPSPLPATAFGIINPTGGGLAFTSSSSCLSAEDSWATGAGSPSSGSASESFYLPLADRGLSSSNYTDPPYSDSPKTCSAPVNDSNADCAYEYGWNQAESALDAASSLDGGGVSHERTVWWLDVENQATNWSDGTTPMSTAQNAQVIEGAHDFLVNHGATSVGLYSNADHVTGDENWPAIVGTSSAFTTYPEWFSSHASTGLGAAPTCATPFAGGSVVLTQVVGSGGSVDSDDAC